MDRKFITRTAILKISNKKLKTTKILYSLKNVSILLNLAEAYLNVQDFPGTHGFPNEKLSQSVTSLQSLIQSFLKTTRELIVLNSFTI